MLLLLVVVHHVLWGLLEVLHTSLVCGAVVGEEHLIKTVLPLEESKSSASLPTER